MSEESPNSQNESIYLSTAEAAARIKLSEGTIRDLCKRGRLPGAYQEHEKGPWRIPLKTVSAWSQDKLKTPDTGSQTWKNRLGRLVGILATVIGLLAIVSILADFGGARRQLLEWAYELEWTRDFPSEGKEEILIVIASFYHSEGIPDTEAHNEIRRAIRQAVDESGISRLRVEVEHTHLSDDNCTGAEALGKRYNVSIIIWGADTGVRVTVNFLNLKQPDLPAAQAIDIKI